MTTILGIDPGSQITGFGVIEVTGNNYKFVAGGAIRLAKDNSYSQLEKIFTEISAIVDLHQPSEVAIEQIFMHANANSALKLGQARGVAIVAAKCQNKNIILAEYSARQVKQAVVGYGAATKGQVQHMVKLLLKLQESPQEDMADALAIAICHAHARKNNLLLAAAKQKYERSKS